MNDSKSYEKLLEEFEEVSLRYREASEMLQAIKTGQVDALVVQTEEGSKLYTLKSADHTYRLFIERMKEGAVTLNKEGIILYSNSQFAAMVDAPISEVIGARLSKYVAQGCLEDFTSLTNAGWESDSKGEILLKNNKDRVIPVLLSLTSLELDEGVSLSVILTELTVQKENENQLRTKNEELEAARGSLAKLNEELEDIVNDRTRDVFLSREYFKFLADNIPVKMWTAGADGLLDYVNRQWCEYTGLDLEKSRNNQAEYIHPDDFEQNTIAWDFAVKNKTKYERQIRLRQDGDGSFRWHNLQAIPFMDQQNNITAWIGTSIDIDDQIKQLEKKDEFISVASHELKTPLTSLKGYVQLIELEKDLSNTTRSYVQKANIAINKLHHLIDELLDASRIKAGKLQFSKNHFNLSDMVSQCVENSRVIYHSHEIRTELQPNIFVHGNEERIEQVFMNLISNAIKYSPGSSEIIVKAGVENNLAVVAVADFGLGMSDPDQKLIFERFYRVNANDKLQPGLGVGLYIASEIIKEHNGSIEVKSKLNQGSIFSFSLPLVSVKE